MIKKIQKLFLKAYDRLTGLKPINWSRVVMESRCVELIQSINPSGLCALEISGEKFQECGFKSYQTLNYPAFDICRAATPEKFDIIIAEQVFEHLEYPYRAGRNVYSMLNPNGFFLVSVPFLVAIHNFPIDCTRWTETGLKYFLEECGFDKGKIQTESWGNRRCVVSNFKGWVAYRSRIHSLKNEPQFPYHVWALAQK